MFVDASALTAILTNEQDARELLARMQRHSDRFTSPLAVWETTIAVARQLGLEIGAAHDAVEGFLDLATIEVRAISPEARKPAIDAFARYGKGRHPAALSFGDCFAYACCRLSNAPLLYKGGDFAQTDIETA